MLGKISIKTRVLALMMFGILAVSVIGGIAAHSLNVIQDETRKFNTENVPAIDTTLEIRTRLGYGGMIHAFKNYVLRHDERYYDRFQELRGELDALFATRKANASVTGEAEAISERLNKVVDAYAAAIEKAKQQIAAGASIDEIDKNVVVNDSGFIESISRLDDLLVNQFKERSNSIQAQIEETEAQLLSILAITIVIAVAFGVFVVYSVTAPLRNLTDATRQAATGDLSVEVVEEGPSEIGNLAHSFNEMIRGLKVVATNNVEISNRISTTLTELTQAISAQSSGATEQASSVDETTATLDEIKATSQQTLDRARDLSEVAESIATQGQRGVESINETITAMDTIREKVEAIADTNMSLSNQTKKIGEITGVVNAMAQELKMLALNASIEAAQAGESGKGFAVVAGEVRKLAEQSEESTVQVQKILEEIQHATDRAVMATEEGTKQVVEGVRLVRQTGDAVDALSKVIQQTADAGQQIVAAVRQEAVGIEQISSAMNEINDVTSQFVTTTTQSKEATVSLSKVVEELKSSVSELRV